MWVIYTQIQLVATGDALQTIVAEDVKAFQSGEKHFKGGLAVCHSLVYCFLFYSGSLLFSVLTSFFCFPTFVLTLRFSPASYYVPPTSCLVVTLPSPFRSPSPLCLRRLKFLLCCQHVTMASLVLSRLFVFSSRSKCQIQFCFCFVFFSFFLPMMIKSWL